MARLSLKLLPEHAAPSSLKGLKNMRISLTLTKSPKIGLVAPPQRGRVRQIVFVFMLEKICCSSTFYIPGVYIAKVLYNISLLGVSFICEEMLAKRPNIARWSQTSSYRGRTIKLVGWGPIKNLF
jgi:hypothetical protein